MSFEPPTLKPRPSARFCFEFSFFNEDPDLDYAQALADAIFELLAEGPSELDEFDYSIDGCWVDEFRRPDGSGT